VRNAIAAVGLALLFAAPDASAQKKAKKAPPKKPAAVQDVLKKLRNRDRGSFVQATKGSAWEALGLNKRFLKPGDRWMMAWSTRQRQSIRKIPVFLLRQRDQALWSKPFLVTYDVKDVQKSKRGRTRATIRIAWRSAHPYARTQSADLTVDQYYNPIAVRLNGRHLPAGSRWDTDTRAIILSVGPFPMYVGDLEHTPPQRASRPKLNQHLAKTRVVWGRSVLQVPVAAGERTYATSYWSPGFPIASAVVGNNIQGVLTWIQAAR
jgi:hypothetical protein